MSSARRLYNFLSTILVAGVMFVYAVWVWITGFGAKEACSAEVGSVGDSGTLLRPCDLIGWLGWGSWFAALLIVVVGVMVLESIARPSRLLAILLLAALPLGFYSVALSSSGLT